MQTWTQRLANPTRFMALSARLLPWISAVAGVLIAVGLYLAFTAPVDYQQGHAAKIMYVHVPAAWLSLGGYALVAASSFGLIVFRHPLGDPRLTAMLILFFLYLGLIALRSSIEDEALAANLTAILGVVGIVMLPIIRFSVNWNSIHQPPSVSRFGMPTIHPSILWPLLVMAAGMTALFAALHLKAMRNEILRRRVRALRLAEVQAAAPGVAQAAE
jgi:heme exporter protein C